MIGQTLSSYRIMAEVTRGGQATLYRAVHISLGRDVALKVLHPHLITVADFRQKFEAEGQILARLKHPNIVAVYDAGMDRGLYYIAMEWLDGKSVDQLIEQRGKLPVDQAVRIIDQAAAALEHAHAQGLIHRDIKPGNMMLLPDGTVKVLDFGIAAMVAAGQKAKTRIGTVEYMSLEQFHGRADQRSDLYSLGASLYHMLTGECPPPLATHPPKPFRQDIPTVPSSLETLIHRLLARDLNGRPQNAALFRQELDAAIDLHGHRAGTFRCPYCTSQNRPRAKYCLACGQQLPTRQRIIGWGPLKLGTSALIVGEVDYEPRFVWSPDGENLAILSQLLTRVQGRSGADLHIVSAAMIEFRQDFPDEDVLWEPDAKSVIPGILPQWSTDGKEVLYVSMADHKLWSLSEPQGEGKAHPVTWGEDTDDDSAFWSPDGQMLLYRAKLRATETSEWRLLSLATKRIIRLKDAKSVAWSPDGDYFVLVGRSWIGEWQSCDLQIYDRSGQLVSNLTGGSYQSYYAGHVKWLDRYRLIVYAKWTDILPKGLGISLFDTREADAHLLLASAWGDFSISPDRQWIATVVQDSDLRGTAVLIRSSDYTTIELKSTITTREGIKRGLASVRVHGWSPDSTKVLFTRGQEIWTVNINDTGLQRITEGYAPQWSPDGRHIAFLRSPQQNVYELWVMRVDRA